MRLFPVLMIGLLIGAQGAAAIAADNTLSEEEKQAGWMLLFNGQDHSGWKCSNDKPVAAPIEEGALVPYKSGGYLIVYNKPFGDFVLKCDVKWDGQCNSGVFFRVADLANPVHTGFEIQVMSGDATGKHQMGAIYDLAGSTKNVSKPAGEWNSMEIKCQGPMISVKVNGEKVSELNCDDFDKPGVCPDGEKHKFQLDGKPRAVKDFARTGYLGFQDHGHKVWYKNVKLLELE